MLVKETPERGTTAIVVVLQIHRYSWQKPNQKAVGADNPSTRLQCEKLQLLLQIIRM